MPKLKTHKGAQKRFKVTGKKKIVHNKAYKSHILTKKSTKRKRHLRSAAMINAKDVASIRRMLPYV